MKWRRKDGAWQLEGTPFSVHTIGETAGAKPCLFGIYKDGKQMTYIGRSGRAWAIVCRLCSDAKWKAEVYARNGITEPKGVKK